MQNMCVWKDIRLSYIISVCMYNVLYTEALGRYRFGVDSASVRLINVDPVFVEHFCLLGI